MTTSQQTRDAWDGVAAGYDKYVTPLLIPLAEEVLRRIDVGPGARFSDVAAGTGALTVPAARIGADVVATDIAPTMIERLKARVRDEGLINVECRVMDARSLEFDADTFDVSASQLGVTVVADLERPLAEMVRVTKPGGQVVIAALGPPQKAEFFGFFLAALKASVPGFSAPPTDPPPPQFQVADPATLRARLVETGLKDERVEAITFGLEISSAAHLWGLLMSSNPMGAALVADLTEVQRMEAQEILTGMLRERADGNAAGVLNMDINIGIGSK